MPRLLWVYLFTNIHYYPSISILGHCFNPGNCLLWPGVLSCRSAEYQWSPVPCHHQHDILKHVCNHQCHHHGGSHISERTLQWHVQVWCLLPHKADCRVASLCGNSFAIFGNTLLHGNVPLLPFSYVSEWTIFIGTIQWWISEICDCYRNNRNTHTNCCLFW